LTATAIAVVVLEKEGAYGGLWICGGSVCYVETFSGSDCSPESTRRCLMFTQSCRDKIGWPVYFDVVQKGKIALL
jgi:hypothetical protein